ncbi:MAG: S9 family peptidase [bacterium]|nr:S9 family peptidase [bacterium]
MRKISIQDLYQIKQVGETTLSPDQKKCVFTVKGINKEKNKYFSHLWILDLETENYYQFTYGDVIDKSPIWSKDNKQIFFIRKNDKETQIWGIKANGGEAYPITNLPEGIIGEINISNDSKIVFTFRPTAQEWTQKAIEERKKENKSNPPRIINKINYKLDGIGFLDNYQHIWLVDTKTKETIELTNGNFEDYSPVISPDGQKVAFFSNRSEDPENNPFLIDLWIISINNKEIQKIHTFKGYKNFLSWSNNGKFLSFIGYESQDDPWVPKNNKLWLLSLDDLKIKCLTEKLDRNIGNSTLSDSRDFINIKPQWINDQYIYFLVTDTGNCNLYEMDIKSHKYKNITNDKIDICSYSVGNEFSILSISTPTFPTELFILKSGELKKITDFNNWINNVSLSIPEEIFFESFDGQKIQGWILKPPDFHVNKKYPLLLYIHGGPHAQYGSTFFHEFQVHCSQGMIVFYTNPRGSMGREEQFASIIRGDWGNIDYKDIIAGVNFISSLPFVDKNNLAVAGGSYGGYMTNWIIAHTDIFKCAITDRSVVDLVSMATTTDFPFMENGYWEGNPWNQTEKLWNQSPIRYADNIKTPLLIIHSEGDLRCPISQAEQLYIALKRLKKEVLFIRYPQETNHGMSRNGPPDLRIDRLQRILEWLKKWIKY